jgi:hypothetical protein
MFFIQSSLAPVQAWVLHGEIEVVVCGRDFVECRTTSLRMPTPENNNNISNGQPRRRGGDGCRRGNDERHKIEKAEDPLQQDCSFFIIRTHLTKKHNIQRWSQEMAFGERWKMTPQPQHQGCVIIRVSTGGRYATSNNNTKAEQTTESNPPIVMKTWGSKAFSTARHRLEIHREEGDGISLTKLQIQYQQ